MTPSPTPRILAAVSDAWSVEPSAIMGRARSRSVAEARHACQWIARMIDGDTFPAIARAWGQPHHSTAIHAIARITRRLQVDALLSRRMAAALELLGEGGRMHAQPCGSFAATRIGGKPVDYLPEFRSDDDVCAVPGCGFRRGRHEMKRRAA